jgi:hypothetical protein
VRWAADAFNAAPLLIQLTSGATNSAIIIGAKATGESDTGTASRPVLYRPSTLGTGVDIQPRRFGQPPYAPTSTLITTFATSPSTPVVNLGAGPVPIRTTWMTDKDNGIVIALGGAICLYANAAGGHLWSGEMIFEEP